MKEARRSIIILNDYHGGRRSKEIEQELVYTDIMNAAIVRYKSMEELMKEFPNFYFDCYGNFNNGVYTDQGYIEMDGVMQHLPPNCFSRMGHTLHKMYERQHGIKDTWYYTVIDK